jgi:hypothetical protein
MNPDLQRIEAALATQDAKLDAIFQSAEKTRKTFQMVMWVTIATIVLPLLLLLFAIPTLIKSLSAYSSITTF